MIRNALIIMVLGAALGACNTFEGLGKDIQAGVDAVQGDNK